MAPYSLVGYYQRFLGVYPNLHNEDVDISSETRVITYQCGRCQIPKRLNSTFDKGIALNFGWNMTRAREARRHAHGFPIG
jgi:hypothetical protein